MATWAVFICRMIPLVRALINYPAGVARMPIGRFLFFSVLGSLPWNAALLLGGILVGANYEALYHAIRPFEIVIYVIVVIGIVVVIALWLRGRDRRARSDRGRLTGTGQPATIAANQNTSPSGRGEIPHRRSARNQRASPRTASVHLTDAADLTLGTRRGRQGRRSQSGWEKATLRVARRDDRAGPRRDGSMPRARWHAWHGAR